MFFVSSSAFSDDIVTIEQAKYHYNEQKTGCGKVAEFVQKNGKTFINFGGSFPRQMFHIYIAGNGYGYPQVSSGDGVCAAWTITEYRGKPQIANPKELKAIG